MTTRPFLIQLMVGDIAMIPASAVAVNHFNGLAPSGAEEAVDAFVNGALSRLAARGILGGHLGATQFLPAHNTPLSADLVLVLALGDPEKFSSKRLPEVGGALVEAAATLRLSDVASIVHGGGSAGVPRREATKSFVQGVLDALVTVPGADQLRELTIVEHAEEHVSEIQAALDEVTPPEGITLLQGPISHVPSMPTGITAAHSTSPVSAGSEQTIPRHLRIGITQSGPDLKVTLIGLGAYDTASKQAFPAQLASTVISNLEAEVLRQDDRAKREVALRSIGAQLYEAFLGWAGCGSLLEGNAGNYLVLRLDKATAGLPWEIVFRGSEFVSRTQSVGRQLEIDAPGRSASQRPPGRGLNVLVVGNPTGDLDAASREGHAIADGLRGVQGATVKALIDKVTYAQVSEELDTTPYDVLHFAGHASFDQTGNQAGGLVLADGVLLRADDLSTRRFLPRFFFANACSSAEATAANLFAGAEPTSDLVTGLLRAGVRAFIGTSWAIDDAAASTFGLSFYNSLLSASSRVSVGHAVSAARDAVVAAHGEGEPAWAAYVLYGNPWTPAI